MTRGSHRLARLALLPLLALTAQGCAELTSLSTGAAELYRPSDPNEQNLYLDLIAGLQDKDMYRASLAHLDEYDRRFSITPRSIRLRAEAFTALDMQDAAVATWQSLLGTSDEAAARNGLGRVAAGANRWDQAANHFLEAVRKEPTSPRYVNNLGYALLRSGDRANAEFRLLQAEELDRDSAEIRRNVILAFIANNKSAEADLRLGRIEDPAARANLRQEAQRAAASLPTRPISGIGGGASVAEARG